MEQERKAFESWYESKFGFLSGEKDLQIGYTVMTRHAWTAWQACLESNNISVQPGLVEKVARAIQLANCNKSSEEVIKDDSWQFYIPLAQAALNSIKGN